MKEQHLEQRRRPGAFFKAQLVKLGNFARTFLAPREYWDPETATRLDMAERRLNISPTEASELAWGLRNVRAQSRDRQDRRGNAWRITQWAASDKQLGRALISPLGARSTISGVAVERTTAINNTRGLSDSVKVVMDANGDGGHPPYTYEVQLFLLPDGLQAYRAWSSGYELERRPYEMTQNQVIETVSMVRNLMNDSNE